MNREDLARMRAIFFPGAVAVLGATVSPDKIGFNLLESLVYGGYEGKIYPVNPKYKSILGIPTYSSVDEIAGQVDLALVGLNQKLTVDAVEQCGKLGVKGAICVASGFRETGSAGQALENRLVQISKQYGIKIVGPNTLGIVNTEVGLNATFYPMRLKRGNISIITQSGGVGFYIIQKAVEEGLGINKWIGVGNRTVLEIADYLEYLAEDPGTKVIALFVEGVEDGRRLVRLAGEVSRQKPVVVYKVGQSDAVNYAAMTHTGSIAGSHRVFLDVFKQFGIMVVESVPELIAACKALSLCRLPEGGRVGMYTYTAGPSIVALDRLAGKTVAVPELSEQTYKKIKDMLGGTPPVILKNPLDSAGLGYRAETYGELVKAVLNDPNIDLLVTFCCPHKNWRNPTKELKAAKKETGKPVLACYISTLKDSSEDRQLLQEAGIPLYVSPDEAAWGAAALVHFGLLKSR